MEWVPTVHEWNVKYDFAVEQAEKNYKQRMTAMSANLQSLNHSLFELLTKNPNPRIELTPSMMELIGKFFRNSVGSVMDRDKLEALYVEDIPGLKRKIEAVRFDPDGSKAKYLHQGMRKLAWKDFSKKLDANIEKKVKRSFSNISLLSAGSTLSLNNLAGASNALRIIGATLLKDQKAVKINLGGMQGKKEFFHSTASYKMPSFPKPYFFSIQTMEYMYTRNGRTL